MTRRRQVFGGYGKRSINRRGIEVPLFQKGYQSLEGFLRARKFMDSVKLGQDELFLPKVNLCDVNVAALSLRSPHFVVPAKVNAQPSAIDVVDSHSDSAA